MRIRATVASTQQTRCGNQRNLFDRLLRNSELAQRIV
jgi:hypothetical protein